MSKFLKFVKTTAFLAALAGSYFLGEFVQPAKQLEMKYKTEILPTEEGFYNGKNKLEYVVNDRKSVELYLVNEETNQKFPIHKDVFGKPEIDLGNSSNNYRTAKGFYNGNLKVDYELNNSDSVEVYLLDKNSTDKYPINKSEFGEPTVNSIDEKMINHLNDENDFLSKKLDIWKNDVKDWYEKNFPDTLSQDYKNEMVK